MREAVVHVSSVLVDPTVTKQKKKWKIFITIVTSNSHVMRFSIPIL